MKIHSKYHIIVATLVVCTLLSACHRTELCYNHFPMAAVTFDWEHEWERDYGTALPSHWDSGHYGFEYNSLKPGVPEWINLIKYKKETPDGEHFFKPEGANLTLDEEAERSFLFYNGDTEYIVFSDIASLPLARASATPRSRASISYIMERHTDSRSANPPDVLYAAYLNDFPVIKNHEVRPLQVRMQPLVYTYVIRYEFEEGLEHVYMSRGALAGMAESVYLRDGRTSDETAIVLYDCEVKDYGCEALVRSFGVPGFPDEYYGRTVVKAEERPYTLNLEVLTTNGHMLEFNFDVADQLRNQPRGGVITVSGIRIEPHQNPPASASGGFDIGVSGWGEVNEDLPI